LERWLIDTSVFVDYLRGYEPALRWLDDLEEPGLICVTTYTELLAGAGSSRIEQKIEGLLGTRRAIRIDAAIARRAGAFVRLYGASHAVEPPDALIAACAEAEGATIATRNVKHFPMLSAVEAPY
jgi:predicted nucleic acid-binding protein